MAKDLENIVDLYPKKDVVITKDKVKKYLPEPPKYRPIKTEKKSKGKFFYIIPIFNIIFSGIAYIIIGSIGKLGIISILFLIFSIPIVLISIFTIFAKLFMDRKKIKNKVTPLIYSNYIRALFLTSNRRVLEMFVPINKDGITFSIGKQDYTIDKEVMFYDEKQRPCCFYVPELPNPLKFMFKKTYQEYFRRLESIGKGDKVDYKSIENDIAFSSINLQLFKKDKIFKDLNTTENQVNEKFVYIILGMMTLMLIALILAVVL